MKFSLSRLSILIVVVALPQVSQASNALNAIGDLIAFIAALISLGVCAIITLIYMLIKKPSKVFAYILLVLNLGVGLFFTSVHFMLLAAFLILNVLVFLKMRKLKKRSVQFEANEKEIESS